jgi:hypothetical protein
MVHTYGGFLPEVDFLPEQVILRPSELSLGIPEHVTYIGPSLQGNRSIENPSPRSFDGVRKQEAILREPPVSRQAAPTLGRSKYTPASDLARRLPTRRLSKKTPRCS